MATWRAACRVHPAPAYLLHVPTLAFPFTTDHFFSPAVTSVKQFSLLPFKVVQKPSFESFQVPSPPTPVVPCGLRATLPSALNTIVNLVFEGVKDGNGAPLKNSAWISFGDNRFAASEPLVPAKSRAAANTLIEVRIASPPKLISRESYVAAMTSYAGHTPA